MGLLSPTASIVRYFVEGDLEKPVIDHVLSGIEKNRFSETDKDRSESISGWTSFENPFFPDFQSDTFLLGTDFVFSLRIDKKTIPPKLIKKHYSMEIAKSLTKSGRDYLSKNQKKEIKEQVIQRLHARIPATPDIFDIVWNFEKRILIFFTTLKSANELLESLFYKSFNASLIRIFPYTLADLGSTLSNSERDAINDISPSVFMV